MRKQRIAVPWANRARVVGRFGCRLRDAGITLTGVAVGMAGALHSEITGLLTGA
jgi:hypothetical protein